MRVKEMIGFLSEFNPDAEVYSVIEHTPFTPCFSFGSKEGCTKMNCCNVFIYIKEHDREDAVETDHIKHRRQSCRCECKTGGPCEHDFSGHVVYTKNSGSVVCRNCGMTAMAHDIKLF